MICGYEHHKPRQCAQHGKQPAQWWPSHKGQVDSVPRRQGCHKLRHLHSNCAGKAAHHGAPTEKIPVGHTRHSASMIAPRESETAI